MYPVDRRQNVREQIDPGFLTHLLAAGGVDLEEVGQEWKQAGLGAQAVMCTSKLVWVSSLPYSACNL